MTAKEQLEEIELKNRSWESDYFKKMEIMMHIIMEINSTKGRKQKFWEQVMDEYNKKYKPEMEKL